MLEIWSVSFFYGYHRSGHTFKSHDVGLNVVPLKKYLVTVSYAWRILTSSKFIENGTKQFKRKVETWKMRSRYNVDPNCFSSVVPLLLFYKSGV